MSIITTPSINPADTDSPPAGPVLIVGNPNVGKSVIFHRLTGRYVTVSNYPGTTVEITRGRSKRLDGAEVIDTPGMYSILPISQEERVARTILLRESPLAVLHVVDARNIQRMLPLTLQFIEARLPVVLVLNMSDEARAAGVRIDRNRLSELLGVPVVETVATQGRGIDDLVGAIGRSTRRDGADIDYGADLEQAIADIEAQLPDTGGVSRRTRALLLLQGDHDELAAMFHHAPAEHADAVGRVVWDTCVRRGHTLHGDIMQAVRARTESILRQSASFDARPAQPWRRRIGNLCMNPWTGFPLLAAVLYLGLYKFVGQFGAGVAVDWLDHALFQPYVAAPAVWAVQRVLPWPAVQQLFVGEYGLVTMGLRYALVIVLPIVGFFFLAFSLLEDSGYLPRLAMLIDRLFKAIGLNGRAVIPMVLGFGCDTMATIVTRTLETRRERIIATFLLALAVPCSAQLGVMLGLLAGHPAGMLVWAAIVTGVFLAAGTLAARLLPGRRADFYMELPLMRCPRPADVLVKTASRMVWYFREVLPLFMLASVLIWLGQLIGAFEWSVNVLKPVVRMVGLPESSATAVLFGFFRRDYGAAGLYDLADQGALDGNQIVVAAVMLTLFLPCIAQLLVMKKEHGWKIAAGVSVLIASLAYGTAWLTHLALAACGVRL